MNETRAEGLRRACKFLVKGLFMDVRYLILSLTNRCNLNCVYCYNGEIRETTDMSEAVLEKALEFAGEGSKPFHMQLTGGEPTLVPELVEAAILKARALQRPCSIGLQTNGTLLTPGLAQFLRENRIQAGVSLDGPPAVQDALRGHAGATLRGLQLLDARQVPFRVTTVVSGNNARHLDRLVYMLSSFAHARGIGLDLLVDKGRANGSADVFPAAPQALRDGIRAMVEALDAVNRKRQVPLELRELKLLNGSREQRDDSTEQAPFCHACRRQSVAVHPDGRLFPCGQTLGDPRFQAGDVWSPEPEKLRVGGNVHLISEECGECPLQGFCPGDCPSRLHYNRGVEQKLVCELYRTLWNTGVGNGFEGNAEGREATGAPPA